MASYSGRDCSRVLEAAGDCETDIATLQAIVDERGTILDRPAPEQTAIGALIASNSGACSLERNSEFFAQDDVAAFLSE